MGGATIAWVGGEVCLCRKLISHPNGDSVTRKVFKLRLWGARLGTKDVLDPNFIVLHCPFNLLRIFKDGAHRSKTEFMVGPSSDVKLTSDTILFALHEHPCFAFSVFESPRCRCLTPEPDSTPEIALF